MKKLFALIVCLSLLMGCGAFNKNVVVNDISIVGGEGLGMYVAATYPDDVSAALTSAKALLSDLQNGNIALCDFQAALTKLMPQSAKDSFLGKLLLTVTNGCEDFAIGTVSPYAVDVIQGFINGLGTPAALRAKYVKMLKAKIKE